MTRTVAFVYIACWVTACLAAGAELALKRRSYALFTRAYWRFVARGWKVATFAVALAFFVVAAPHTGDPTWDWIDASFMSVLTFATAPWSVGVMVRGVRRKLPRRQMFVAGCVWMFSASWSYDLYILLRDGFYPPTWSSNIVASSVLYACAGMMWSLELRPGRGLTFAFLEPEWFETHAGGSSFRVIAFALVFMALVAAMMLPFVWELIPIPGR